MLTTARWWNGITRSSTRKSLVCTKRQNGSEEVFGVARNGAPELEGHVTEWSGVVYTFLFGFVNEELM